MSSKIDQLSELILDVLPKLKGFTGDKWDDVVSTIIGAFISNEEVYNGIIDDNADREIVLGKIKISIMMAMALKSPSLLRDHL